MLRIVGIAEMVGGSDGRSWREVTQPGQEGGGSVEWGTATEKSCGCEQLGLEITNAGLKLGEVVAQVSLPGVHNGAR